MKKMIFAFAATVALMLGNTAFAGIPVITAKIVKQLEQQSGNDSEK